MTARFRLTLLTGALWLGSGQGLAQSWLDARAGIEELSAAGNTEAAAELGETYLDEVRARHGDQGPELPDSMLLLAGLEVDLGEADAAAERIRSAIDLLGRIDTPESTRLVDAYTMLGEAYSASAANALAIEAFVQAQDLSRRKLGLYNEMQIDILYRMARIAIDEGDTATALAWRQEALEIYQRSRIEAVRRAAGVEEYGGDRDAFLDARLRYADLLLAEGLARDAMQSFRETLEIIDDEFGNSSSMRARVFLAQSEALGANLTTLQRARRTINITREPDPELRAALRREWGDWRMLAGLPDKAERAYRDSWKLLDDVENGEALRREWFGEAEFIREAGNGLMSNGVLTLSPEAPLGEVAVDFVIDSTGRAQQIRVVTADPQWIADFAARQIAGSVFRPRFVDGELIQTPGRVSWSFRYDPEVAASFGLTPDSAPAR